jgi:hypothetical protein
MVNPIVVNAVRYGLPAVLIVVGTVIGATGGAVAVAGGALFISAGTAVLLVSVLFRIGVEGDKARDREEEARRFFDEHGHWPDEPERR